MVSLSVENLYELPKRTLKTVVAEVDLPDHNPRPRIDHFILLLSDVWSNKPRPLLRCLLWSTHRLTVTLVIVHTMAIQLPRPSSLTDRAIILVVLRLTLQPQPTTPQVILVVLDMACAAQL
jgi:hypothetical protein